MEVSGSQERKVSAGTTQAKCYLGTLSTFDTRCQSLSSVSSAPAPYEGFLAADKGGFVAVINHGRTFDWSKG